MWRPNQTALIYSAALWLASGLMALVLHLVPMLSQGGIPPLQLAFAIWFFDRGRSASAD